jgi:F0F1-type ATP synthase assembly protein I
MVEQPQDPSAVGTYFAMSQVGFEIVGSIGLGLLLDYYLNWQPWGIIGGTVLGFVGGIYHLIVLASKANKQEARGKKPGGERQ